LIAGPISYAWTFLFAGRVVSGIGFALLVGVACTHGRTLAVLSWRPLVRLGVISYSVYLTHQPVEQGAEFFLFKYIHSLLPGIALSLTAGLAFGAAFFWVVERPVLRRESWLAVSPYLLRAVAWTDRVYPDVRAQLEPIASEAPQGALAEA
jgi:peptidoglycan/LPS O-acetylase OafA/YrhL